MLKDVELDQSTVRFCSECNNMLYPKEQRSTRSLYYICKNCDHQEPAVGYIVSTNNILRKGINRNAGRVDLASDPTLPRTSRVKCPRCSYHQAVFFHERDRFADAPSLTLTFVCCNINCNYQWKDDTASI